MSFAIPTTDPTAIRCHAIISRLVNMRPGSAFHDEAAAHGADWIANREGARHPHPVIGIEGDGVIRALVEDPENQVWLEAGRKWLVQFDSATRAQHRTTICLPDCRNTSDLIANNID